jgi:hypothetical protein
LLSAQLQRHGENSRDAVERISAHVHKAGQSIEVTYVLEGNLPRVLVPRRGPPRRAQNLWQHTCFEIFVRRRNQPGYREFNFSPSGEWSALDFTRYRRGTPLSDDRLDPRITVSSSATRFELKAIAHHEIVEGKLLVALSAVIEDASGALTYWALKHPPGAPDFHHADGFALELA